MTHAALKMPCQSFVTFHKPKLNLVESKPQNRDSCTTRVRARCATQGRVRGVLLTLQGWNKLKTAKSQAEFQEDVGNCFTLEELSERSKLSLGTISKILGRSEPVDRSSLQTVFRCFELELNKTDYTRPASKTITQKHSKTEENEPVDISFFCGRETELSILQQWILEEHCRLLAIIGIGGSGKSSLAVKLASQIEQEFEVVIFIHLLRHYSTFTRPITSKELLQKYFVV